jgi:hypothetical protein
MNLASSPMMADEALGVDQKTSLAPCGDYLMTAHPRNASIPKQIDQYEDQSRERM